MKHFVFGLCLLVFTATQLFADPGDQLITKEYPATNSRTDSRWSPFLTDIIQHMAPGDSNNYDDKVTLAHETSHGIHAYIRNYLNDTGSRANGFYIGNNQAVLVKEPNIRKRQIAAFVPSNLRGSRFNLYVTGSADWDDTPLYIWDEWVAYTNGGQTGVDLHQHNLWNDGWRDAVAGPLEMNVYAIATAMAVKQFDPTYFSTQIQFKEFLAFNTERTMEVFFVGREISDFAWDVQDQFYQKFTSSAEAEPMRRFLRETFGDDWVRRVLRTL